MHASRRWIAALLLILASLCATNAFAQGAQGKIAFSRYTYYPGGALRHINLYSINPDGSAFRQLTPTIENHYRFDPAWSPHGTSLAYALATGPGAEDWNIWRVDANGATRRRLTSGVPDFRYPSWNPAGTLLGFRSNTPNFQSVGTCVGVVRPDGTGQRNVLCAPAGAVMQETPPFWLPDGRMLAVVRRIQQDPNRPPDTFLDVYRITVSTGQSRLLQSIEVTGAYALFFAPDGRRAIISTRYEGSALSYVDLETGQQMGGYPPGYSPVWAPDSRHFAFASLVLNAGFPTDDVGHLFVADITVPESARDLNVAMTPGLHYVPNAWSPDGTRILATRTVWVPESPGSSGFVAQDTLRLLDANTPYIDTLVTGHAEMDAWFSPP